LGKDINARTVAPKYYAPKPVRVALPAAIRKCNSKNPDHSPPQIRKRVLTK
jgi:hypothetical protein